MHKGDIHITPEHPNHILYIDKPKWWSSFDIIRYLNRTYQLKRNKIKIGHAGTLDPFATGLVILCTGKNTKRISEFQDMQKKYRVDIVLGATTKTYDSEYEPERFVDSSHITKETIAKVVADFIGEIQQTPPIYSAIKIDGARAYNLARKGEEVEIPTRTVHIYDIDIIAFETNWKPPYNTPNGVTLSKLVLDITCSKGTYIRSLAFDIGTKLGVGGYAHELRRTTIGEHTPQITLEGVDFIPEHLMK